EKVLDIADKRISSSTDRVEDFITAEEIEEVARAYRDVAGFRKKMDAL
ncbi:MAG TPA: flavin-dependent oxidoreductase, partial [Dehalococcoidia bacterium]|nr:flavin-dependent oxidoreductase [Dehalococcoidia bacterium]